MLKKQYKFYPQGLTNFAGYMTEEDALEWLKINLSKNKELIGFEIIELMSTEDAYKYLTSLKSNA